MAEVHGHGWFPFSGEDLAAMVRTGRPPRDVFSLLEQSTHRGDKYVGSVMHLMSDSTCKFSGAKIKRLGPFEAHNLL
eukprot:6154899-Pyramimonas_sp.AAC.1